MIPTTPATSTSTTTTTGFSLSPGGLLLPYHVGVIEALTHYEQITPTTPLAGSSAGSIAVAAHACGVEGSKILDATSQIAKECESLGGARGRLLPRLRTALNELLTEDEYQQLVARPGPVAIAYQEVLPRYRSQHQTSFEDRDDLVNAICHSSTFPFFTTNWPVALDTRSSSGGRRIPRLVCDGFFAVPRARFGCPDFELAEVKVDRTVMISVFPQEKIRLEAASTSDCISPPYKGGSQLETLFRIATQSSTTKREYYDVYEAGWKDAEEWVNRENQARLLN